MNYFLTFILLTLTCSLAADDRDYENRQADIKRQQREYDNRQYENRQEDIKQQQRAAENRNQVNK